MRFGFRRRIVPSEEGNFEQPVLILSKRCVLALFFTYRLQSRGVDVPAVLKKQPCFFNRIIGACRNPPHGSMLRTYGARSANHGKNLQPDVQTASVNLKRPPLLGEANAVNVEAKGNRAHYIDGVSEPYN